MPELKVTIQCEQDGVELPGFPLIFREIVTESVPLEVQKTPDNNTTSYSQVPGTIPGTLQVLVLSFDQALNFRLNGAVAGSLPMNAAGCLVLVGSNIAAGAATNITVNNPAATGSANANLVGVAAGAP